MTKRPKIANPEGRSTPEWIGKTPDTPAPDHVKWRVLLRFDRKCGITGRPIRPGAGFEVDHITALIDGGKNRESNLQPVLREPHARKTAEGNTRQAKADAVGKTAYGITKSKRPLEGGPQFPKREERAGKIDKASIAPLPRRNPFTGEVYPQ